MKEVRETDETTNYVRLPGIRGHAGRPPGFKVVKLQPPKKDDKGKRGDEIRLMNGSGTIWSD